MLKRDTVLEAAISFYQSSVWQTVNHLAVKKHTRSMSLYHTTLPPNVPQHPAAAAAITTDECTGRLEILHH